MSRITLVGKAVVPDGVRRVAVIIREARISAVVEPPFSGKLPKDLLGERREVSGLICPGFIDLQVNGAFGMDLGGNAAGLKDIASRLPETGTTSFLPTFTSRPAESYGPLLDTLDVPPAGARVLGVHLEGPFLSPARQGAHDPDNLRPVDLGLLAEVLDSGLVKVMTLAPELAGAEKAAGMLRESGALASLGHTNATYKEALRAVDAGFSKATHLFNAMSPFEHRAPGTVGAVLTDHRLRAGIITDGVHVHPGALRLAYREKDVEGLALVTDAVAAAGMEDGEYRFNGRRVRLEAGSVRLPDGTLAGSALTMDAAVRNAAHHLDLPLEQAVRMASGTPASILGLSGKGRVEAGADADLVVLSPEGVVEETIVAGKSVYRRA